MDTTGREGEEGDIMGEGGIRKEGERREGEGREWGKEEGGIGERER